MRRTAGSTALVALVLVGLGACSGASPPAAVPAASTTAVTSSPAAEPVEPSTTEPATSDTSTSTPTASPTSATVSPSVTATDPTPSPRATQWPKALGEPGQGDPVWAVYLALAHSSDDPAVERALRDASAVGYTAVQGDLACDQGAIEALGLDQYDYWSAVTLYFATQSDAADFVASYRAEGRKVAGSTKVNVGCLD